MISLIEAEVSSVSPLSFVQYRNSIHKAAKRIMGKLELSLKELLDQTRVTSGCVYLRDVQFFQT